MRSFKKFQAGLLFLLPMLLSSQQLVYHSGVLTFSCDRPDTALLLSANEELRHLDLVFGGLTNLRVQDSITVHFYFNRRLVAGTLPDAPYWSGGVARSGNEIHIFDQDRVQWRQTLKHELAHTILAQNQVRVPTWFNEGLAQSFADQWTWQKFTTLGEARSRGQLIPLAEIDHLFSFGRLQAQLAYAEAQHAFRFLADHYGQGVIPALLQPDSLAFRDHFQKITGESLADFEIAWREHLKAAFWFFGLTRFPGYLWVLMPLVLIAGYLMKRRQNRMKLEAWEEEDRERSRPRYEA